MMATDEQPLLPRDIYARFSPRRKRAILAIVSLTGLVPLLVGASFVPSVPQISRDLHASPAAVSLGVSLSVLASSVGVMLWSAYTSFYGRRAIYLCGLPFAVLGSLFVAVSTDLPSLLCWRFVQTFGCSGGFAIGAATIGDIYKVEERGTAIGTFLGASLFGLAIAPPLGGILAEYWSWRGFQASLGACSAILWLLLFVFFPETAHPGTRGVDKAQGPRWSFVWINPFRCLTFLRSPNLLMVALANTFALASDFTLMIPIAYTIAAKYGVKGEALVGILFLPSGIGNVLGAPVAGWVCDRAIRHAKEMRKGVWVPEDRLRAAWLGGLVLTPVSVILAGFTTEYVDGTIGLVICLVCLFCNGVGVDMVLTPIGTYIVDVMPTRSAEVVAAVTALRSLLIVPLSALCIPSVDTIGVAATDSIAGILSLFGYALIWLTIRYGKQMRAYVDVGYPDFDAQASVNGRRDGRSL